MKRALIPSVRTVHVVLPHTRVSWEQQSLDLLSTGDNLTGGMGGGGHPEGSRPPWPHLSHPPASHFGAASLGDVFEAENGAPSCF